MPVCGLVLTVSEEPRRRAMVRRALLQEPGVTLGADGGLRWPVVLETSDPRQEAARLDRIGSLPGVLAVEVAYHDFSDVEEVPRELTGRRRGKGGSAHPPEGRAATVEE